MMKTSGKIIIIISLIITIAVSSVISVMGINNRMKNNSKKQYSIISEGVYEAVQSAISKPVYTGLTMASDVFVSDLLQNEEEYTDQEFEQIVSRYLIVLKDATNAQTTFMISDNTKKYYTYEGLNKIVDPQNDDHDVWYSIFINTRKKYDLDVDVDQVNENAWTVFVNTRIEDENGKLLGVCGLGLAMDDLQNILKEYEDNYNIKINFIDSEGRVQIDTDDVNIESAVLHDVQYGKEKDGYAYFNNEGEYVVMRFVDSLNWYLVIHGNPEKMTVENMLPIILGGMFVVVVNTVVLLIVSRKKKQS